MGSCYSKKLKIEVTGEKPNDTWAASARDYCRPRGYALPCQVGHSNGSHSPHRMCEVQTFRNLLLA